MLPIAQTPTDTPCDCPRTYRVGELTSRFNRLYGRVDDLLPDAERLQIAVIGGDVSGVAAFGFAALSPKHRYGVTALETDPTIYEVGQYNSRGFNVCWHDLSYMQPASASKDWNAALQRHLRQSNEPRNRADVLFFGERLSQLPLPQRIETLATASRLLRDDGRVLMPVHESQQATLEATGHMAGLKLVSTRSMPDPLEQRQGWHMARLAPLSAR